MITFDRIRLLNSTTESTSGQLGVKTAVTVQGATYRGFADVLGTQQVIAPTAIVPQGGLGNRSFSDHRPPAPLPTVRRVEISNLSTLTAGGDPLNGWPLYVDGLDNEIDSAYVAVVTETDPTQQNPGRYRALACIHFCDGTHQEFLSPLFT